MNDIMRPSPQPKPRAPLPAPQPSKPQPEPNKSLDVSSPSNGIKIEKPKKRSLKWLWISLLVLLVLLVGAAGAAYWWYNDNLQAKSDSSEHIRVKVESGDSADHVAQELENKGIIRSALAMTVYMRLNGKTNVKTGEYLFEPNQTPQEIVGWLLEGRIDTFKVTLIPGNTLAKIKNRLIQYGYKAADIDAAFAAHYDSPLLADKPASVSLEGYIYPDTYFVTSDTTVQQLLAITFAEFEKQLDKGNYRAQLAAMNFTLHQGLTLASIIEKEVGSNTDRRQVAQVFEKRLHDGMALGSDVTYIYAASLMGVEPSSTLDSPYNTRKYQGLPPGPIANFSISALEAVIKPATGSYLYFVAGDDGNTYFAYTLAEHQQNIAKYCHKLCSSN